MSFQERILSSTSQNAQLLQSIAETAHAPLAAQQTAIYISELQSQVSVETKNLKSLHWKVEEKRSESGMYRDRTKGFASKFNGKEALVKAEKAELEYQEIIETEAKTRIRLEQLQANLTEAQMQLPVLEQQVRINSQAQTDLDILYNSVFSLPHNASLEETRAQEAALQAKVANDKFQRQVDDEAEVIAFLTDAHRRLIWAHNSVLNALEANERVQQPSLHVSRNAAAIAQLNAAQAETFLRTARRLRPLTALQSIPPLAITQPTYLVDDDTPPGASRRLDAKMKASESELKRAEAVVWDEVEKAKERLASLEPGTKGRMQRWREKSVELRELRGEVWRVVVEQCAGERA